MNFLLLTASLFVFAALQARLPTLWWLGGLRLELLPALVAFGALTFRHRRWALSLAIAAGLFHDALSAGPFGATAVAYAGATLALTPLAHNFDRDTFWMQLLAGGLASVSGSAAALCVVGVHAGALGKLLLLAMISAAVTPPVFLGLDSLRHRTRPA